MSKNSPTPANLPAPASSPPVAVVTPTDTEGVAFLKEMALDLRSCWNHAADKVWRTIDPDLWTSTHNPWAVLNAASQDQIARLLADPAFRKDMDALAKARRQRMSAPAWFQQEHPKTALTRVAYFSMEFMLSESLPIYSGGLVNVAGDQLKAACDLGVPVVGIGLLCQQGYFRQVIDKDGGQEALYPHNDPEQLPITPVRTPDGKLLRLENGSAAPAAAKISGDGGAHDGRNWGRRLGVHGGCTGDPPIDGLHRAGGAALRHRTHFRGAVDPAGGRSRPVAAMILGSPYASRVAGCEHERAPALREGAPSNSDCQRGSHRAAEQLDGTAERSGSYDRLSQLALRPAFARRRDPAHPHAVRPSAVGGSEVHHVAIPDIHNRAVPGCVTWVYGSHSPVRRSRECARALRHDPKPPALCWEEFSQ